MKPELKIVFDTSVLYTGSVSDLLREEVATFVQESKGNADLAVHCYLPEVVVSERQFQMQNKALDLLPHIRKVEKLLGHNLAINSETLEGRVIEVTKKQIQHLGLLVRSLDATKVDWKRLINDAAFRRPPFEKGDREKGFRDSVVIETFIQLVDDSPTTPTVCRIVLLSGDNLLSEAAQSRTAQRSNVRVMASLEEVKGLISTLIAAVDEKFIAKIQPKANTYFFEKSNQDSLVYKENLLGKIKDKFSAELSALPPRATTREVGKWFVSPPRFVNKQGQRIYWATRISIESKATRFESTQPIYTGLGLALPYLPSSTTEEQEALNLLGLGELSEKPVSTVITPATGLATLSSDPPSLVKAIVVNGKTEIEVEWNVSVSVAQRFSKPKIESINFIETVWDT